MAASSSNVVPGLIQVHKQLQKKEKTPTLVFRLAEDANRYVATEIANLIRTSPTKPVVLGLATGSTPVGTFAPIQQLRSGFLIMLAPDTMEFYLGSINLWFL